MANDFFALAQSGPNATDSTRLFDVTDQNLYKPRPNQGALNFYKMLQMQGVYQAEASKYRVIIEYPFTGECVARAAASAGATTLTVDSSDELVFLSRLINTRTNEQYLVTSNPTSSTSVSVGAITYAVQANDVLQILGPNVEENWRRGNPIMRGTEMMTQYISNLQCNMAVTFETMRTKRWGNVTEVARLEEQMNERREAYRHKEVMLGKQDAGTSVQADNVKRRATKGIYWWGLEYNRHVFSGTMNFSQLANAVYQLKKSSLKPTAQIALLCGQALHTQISTASARANMVRYTAENQSTFGVGKADIKLPIAGAEVMIVVDEIFDSGDLANKAMLVNFANAEAAGMGAPFLVKPTAERPNGDRDIATGSAGWQYNEYMGVKVNYPPGFAALLENVRDVRW